MHTPLWKGGRHDCDRMVAGFTTTCAISAYHCRVFSFNTLCDKSLSVTCAHKVSNISAIL